MLTSTDRILTKHTGSLPRPSWLTADASSQEVNLAVAEVVQSQLPAGKPSYATYVLTG